MGVPLRGSTAARSRREHCFFVAARGEYYAATESRISYRGRFRARTMSRTKEGPNTLAEEEGFEPPVGLHPRLFSRQMPLTTQPLLRESGKHETDARERPPLGQGGFPPFWRQTRTRHSAAGTRAKGTCGRGAPYPPHPEPTPHTAPRVLRHSGTMITREARAAPRYSAASALISAAVIVSMSRCGRLRASSIASGRSWALESTPSQY